MKSGWSYLLAMALRGAGNRELRQISSMNAGAPTVLYKISKSSSLNRSQATVLEQWFIGDVLPVWKKKKEINPQMKRSNVIGSTQRIENKNKNTNQSLLFLVANSICSRCTEMEIVLPTEIRRIVLDSAMDKEWQAQASWKLFTFIQDQVLS